MNGIDYSDEIGRGLEENKKDDIPGDRNSMCKGIRLHGRKAGKC